eukprot:TRINITY_DN708_c0_g2_i2.p2 TRINITY_DN708_c0_g2~~TRINITY_DN708_c0_g2_i2.p2  ORF type:complete len:245 (-),score=31.16 TRINITY_DN708_c0_g2_i2:2714-3448(-)
MNSDLRDLPEGHDADDYNPVDQHGIPISSHLVDPEVYVAAPTPNNTSATLVTYGLHDGQAGLSPLALQLANTLIGYDGNPQQATVAVLRDFLQGPETAKTLIYLGHGLAPPGRALPALAPEPGSLISINDIMQWASRHTCTLRLVPAMCGGTFAKEKMTMWNLMGARLGGGAMTVEGICFGSETGENIPAAEGIVHVPENIRVTPRFILDTAEHPPQQPEDAPVRIPQHEYTPEEIIAQHARLM